MPRKSTIETQLDDDDKGDLGKLIASGKWTLDGLLEWLGERGYEISRSALHRHVKKTERVAARLRESRAVTDALVAELGDAAAQGKQGRLLVEMTRSIVFDLLMKIQDATDESGAAQLDAKDVAMLGKGLAEMGRALRFDQDFETKIREQVAKEAAARTEKALAREGVTLDPDALRRIREEVYGIAE